MLPDKSDLPQLTLSFSQDGSSHAHLTADPTVTDASLRNSSSAEEPEASNVEGAKETPPAPQDRYRLAERHQQDFVCEIVRSLYKAKEDFPIIAGWFSEVVSCKVRRVVVCV
jgi:hypothetical protein